MKPICQKYLMTFLPIYLSLLAAGCIDLPTDFKAPKWDVDINLPFVNRTYTLNDIIKKQNYISITGTSSKDSIYLIQSDEYWQSTDVSKFIQATTPTSSTGNPIPVSGKIDTSVTVYLPIPDGAILQKAVFSGGILKFHVTNPAPVTAYLSILFPGISKNGSLLSVSLTAAPGDNQTVQYSLEGYTYNLPVNQLFTNQDKIQTIIGSSMPGGPVISFLTLDCYSSDFYFSSFTGYLPIKSLGTKTNSFPINIGQAEDYRDNVSLKNGTLNLRINYLSQNSDPFGLELKNINIIGQREDGSKIYLRDASGNKDLSIKLTNGSSFNQYTQDNSNINSFISFLPSSIVLNAEYIMNPDGTTGTVTSMDSIKFTADFSSTSALAFKSSVITDTTSIEITDADGVKIKDAKSAYINISVQNGIPLNAAITFTFLDSRYNRLFSLKNSGPDTTISFGPAAVNSSGEVTSLTTSGLSIQLDSLQTEMLSRTRYVTYSAAVYTNTNNKDPKSDAKYVTIRPNNVLKINVYGSVKYHVNTDDLK